jgi:hypothetical protein
MKPKTIISDIIISALGSWLIAIIYSYFQNNSIIPMALTGWFILFLFLLFIQSQRIIYRYSKAPQHFLIQGENVDFISANFNLITDDLDETGITIINKKDWRLVFDFLPKRTSFYVSNIRFKKGSPISSGQINYCIENGETSHPEKIFKIEDFPDDQYSYIDMKFHTNLDQNVKIIIEPIDVCSNQPMAFSFDRLEVYEILDRQGQTYLDRKKRLIGGILFTVGFILSPLTWWNDIVINLPLSYVLAQLLKLIDQSIFNISFIIIYWMTNLSGLLLMHYGGKLSLDRESTENRLIKFLLVSAFYTLLIFVLIHFDIVKNPLHYISNSGISLPIPDSTK